MLIEHRSLMAQINARRKYGFLKTSMRKNNILSDSH